MPDSCYNKLVYYVYILQSLKDKSLYIGYTPDLRQRLPKHNKKQVTSTKNKAPWKLIYYEAYLEKKRCYWQRAISQKWRRLAFYQKAAKTLF